ncbi:hypothetical protein BDW67DRAFT_180757 [Aspergillus spinulosporus]
MSPPPANPVGPEKASAIAETILRSFTTSTVSSFFLRTPESTWSPNNVPYELILEHFGKAVAQKAQQGAALVKPLASRLWLFGDSLRTCTITPRMTTPPQACLGIRAYTGRSQGAVAVRTQALVSKLIGRDARRKEKGVVRALVQPYLERAWKDGVSVWLEAVDEHSRDIYAHFGFRTVEVFRVGVGDSSAFHILTIMPLNFTHPVG